MYVVRQRGTPSAGGSDGAVFDGFTAAVVRARESGLSPKEVAAKYEVSLAWVNRWLQRRRDTGTLAPRKQTHWREPKLAAHTTRLRALVLAQPDRTLEELRDALGISDARSIHHKATKLTKSPRCKPPWRPDVGLGGGAGDPVDKPAWSSRGLVSRVTGPPPTPASAGAAA